MLQKFDNQTPKCVWFCIEPSALRQRGPRSLARSTAVRCPPLSLSNASHSLPSCVLGPPLVGPFQFHPFHLILYATRPLVTSYDAFRNATPPPRRTTSRALIIYQDVGLRAASSALKALLPAYPRGGPHDLTAISSVMDSLTLQHGSCFC